MCEKISRPELVRAGPKISPGGLPVSSINSVNINIYSGTPRIGAESWEFAFFALKITPRIGAPFT